MGTRGREAGSALVRVLLCLAAVALLALPCGGDQPPPVPPPKPVHLPAPAIRVLPNGLKVAVIERHSLPILTLRLVVESGAEADPPNLAGAAELVSSLINQGTAGRSAQEIARAVDHVGGVMNTDAEWDDSFVDLSVLTDHAEFAFDMVADMAQRPAFAPAEIERQRKQALSALEVSVDDPAYVADTVFDCLMFAGTPYGHPADGTLDAVRRIKAEDIREFYSRRYRPSNAILAVVGDITPDRAFELATKYFAQWHEDAAGAGRDPSGAAGQGTETSPLPAQEQDIARQIVVIDKPDAVQTEIRVGNRGLPRRSPDYVAMTVANQILGGPAANRLYRALRIEHGLTYSASSDLDCYKLVGSWESKTSTRTAETMKGVRTMLDEMKQLREHPINDFELHTAQSYLTGNLGLDVEPASGLASHMLELMVYNLPLDFWDQLPLRLDKVNEGQVLDATRRYLDLDRDVIVLVGNAEAFRKDLKKLGDFRIIPIDRLDLSSPSLERTAAAQ